MEFIEKLPQGFFTHLTENGGNLSGGQRQRLALVRMLYLDAPILLLDEPSSALDAKAELMLADALVRWRSHGKTIVVATHTERLLEVADVVVRVESGRIAAAAPVACKESHQSAERLVEPTPPDLAVA